MAERTYTIDQLEAARAQLRPVFRPVGRVLVYDINPVPEQRSITFQARAQALTKPNPRSFYNLVIQFFDVQFGARRDDSFPIAGRTRATKLVYFQRLSRSKNTIRAHCMCQDERFTWAWYNQKVAAHAGPDHPPYKRKTTTYPERNPLHVPGVCKHLHKLIQILESRRLLVA